MTGLICPTVTQRVRGFFADENIPVRPWSTLDETYSALHEELRVRHDEPTRWHPVETLLRDILRDLADPQRRVRLPAPSAELLASWDIDELVQGLKEAVSRPGPNDGVFSLSAFAATLSAPVLGGFLLFGLAAFGCDDGTAPQKDETATQTDETATQTDETDTQTDGTSSTQTTWADECTLEQTDVYFTTLNDSNALSDDEKLSLCECFRTATGTEWGALLETIFRRCSPVQVAAVLEKMVDECADSTSNPTALATDLQETFDSCSVALYKGVAFPD